MPDAQPDDIRPRSVLTAGDLLALADEIGRGGPYDDSLSDADAGVALARMVRAFFAETTAELRLPVEVRDHLLGGWVTCIRPWATTAGPSGGVGGMAVTACGTCAGCRLMGELIALAPTTATWSTCANCDEQIVISRLEIGGTPSYVHGRSGLALCDPAATNGHLARPIETQERATP